MLLRSTDTQLIPFESSVLSTLSKSEIAVFFFWIRLLLGARSTYNFIVSSLSTFKHDLAKSIMLRLTFTLTVQ